MAKMSKHDARWKMRLEELRQVANANGGKANVPQRNREQPELGNWCMTQVRRSSPARQLIEEVKFKDIGRGQKNKRKESVPTQM